MVRANNRWIFNQMPNKPYIFWKLYFLGIQLTKNDRNIWSPLTSNGNKSGIGRKFTKNYAFFIQFPTFGRVRQTVWNWDSKPKILYIILTFSVIYVTIGVFKGGKNRVNTAKWKSLSEYLFLNVIDKIVHSFHEHRTNYIRGWWCTLQQIHKK